MLTEHFAGIKTKAEVFCLFPGEISDFTALDFLLYVAALKGLDDKKAKNVSNELLDEVGLSGERRRKIKTFSGGMKQRLGIAQAMLNDPYILILDEPTAGLQSPVVPFCRSLHCADC